MQHEPHAEGHALRFDPKQVTHPDSALLKHYIILALFTGPLFPITMLPMLFKYHTLRYKFDDEGIAMSWGILFRREVYLTYRRIQDIHVTRGIIQRWLGLATVSVQTASGSATPEAAIEGVLAFDGLRDYLYQKMRGAKGLAADPEHGKAAADDSNRHDESLLLLREIRDSLASIAAKGGRS